MLPRNVVTGSSFICFCFVRHIEISFMSRLRRASRPFTTAKCGVASKNTRALERGGATPAAAAPVKPTLRALGRAGCARANARRAAHSAS